MNTKDTNPKDALGIRRVPTHLVPPRVIAELGLALLEGACKYGAYNWRAAGVRGSVYFDALQRHLGAWWEGENIDADSGLSHVTKAIACLTIVRDSMLQGNFVDDRPIRGQQNWVAGLNAMTGTILDKYPDKKEPYTETAHLRQQCGAPAGQIPMRPGGPVERAGWSVHGVQREQEPAMSQTSPELDRSLLRPMDRLPDRFPDRL